MLSGLEKSEFSVVPIIRKDKHREFICLDGVEANSISEVVCQVGKD